MIAKGNGPAAMAEVMAPAKLNLALLVGPLRPDGFHEIASLIVPVTLADRVVVERHRPRVEPAEDRPGLSGRQRPGVESQVGRHPVELTIYLPRVREVAPRRMRLDELDPLAPEWHRGYWNRARRAIALE